MKKLQNVFDLLRGDSRAPFTDRTLLEAIGWLEEYLSEASIVENTAMERYTEARNRANRLRQRLKQLEKMHDSYWKYINNQHHAAPRPFTNVRKLDQNELIALGCRIWDKADEKGRVLLQLPSKWYKSIPPGFRLECITGKKINFEPGKTDDDTRFGCLAYGIRVTEMSRKVRSHRHE